MVLGVRDIEDIYDIPTPTRLSPWGEEKKVDNKGYKDPYPQPMTRRAMYQGIKSAPTNSKPVEITFPDGKSKIFDSIGEAARHMKCSPETIRKFFKGLSPSYAEYSGRYIDG